MVTARTDRSSNDDRQFAPDSERSTLLAVPVAAVLSIGSIALFPHLTAPGRRRQLARAAYSAVGLGVAFALSTPLDLSVGDPLTLTYFLVLVALAAFDLSDRGWRNVA